MIIRELERCPRCGQWDPWRKTSSRLVRGLRRLYVKCRRCGLRETVEYHAPEGCEDPPAPERGTI